MMQQAPCASSLIENFSFYLTIKCDLDVRTQWEGSTEQLFITRYPPTAAGDLSALNAGTDSLRK
jgi:hypothetical protein